MSIVCNYLKKEASGSHIGFYVKGNADTIIVDLKNLDYDDLARLHQVLSKRFTNVRNSKNRLTIDHKSHLDRREYKLSKTGYSNQYFLEHRTFLSVFTNPIYPRMPEIRITFHQSQIGKIKKTFELFKDVFGNELAKKIITKGILSRLDICLDLNLGINEILSNCNRPGVRLLRKDQSKKDTVYIGSKKPVQVVVYEKKTPAMDSETLTRIEIRTFGPMNIPIRHVSELGLLENYSLFKCFKLYRLDVNRWNLLCEDNLKLSGFNASRLACGFISAKAKSNKDRNYHRDIGKYWKECIQNIDLDQVFKLSFSDIIEEFKTPYFVSCFFETKTESITPPYDDEHELIDDEHELIDDEHELIDDEHELIDDEHELIDDEHELIDDKSLYSYPVMDDTKPVPVIQRTLLDTYNPI